MSKQKTKELLEKDEKLGGEASTSAKEKKPLSEMSEQDIE